MDIDRYVDYGDACAKAKAKAKGVTKKASEPPSKPGERLYFDTAGLYSTSLGGSTYWVMAVDDHSRYKYSGFMKKKSDIGDFAETIFKKVQAAGHTIKYVIATTQARISGTFKMLVIK